MKKIIYGFLMLSALEVSRPAQSLADNNLDLEPTLDPSVREVSSAETERFIYRAIEGLDGVRPYLVIEKIPRGSKRVDNILRWNISSIKGGNSVRLDAGWHLSSLHWESDGLAFLNSSASGSLLTSIACKVLVFTGEPIVSCKKI